MTVYCYHDFDANSLLYFVVAVSSVSQMHFVLNLFPLGESVLHDQILFTKNFWYQNWN